MTPLDHLKQLVDDLNSTKVQHWGVSEEVADTYAKEVRASILRQYNKQDAVGEKRLRASSLGKPAVVQAMAFLGYSEGDILDNRLRHIFHTGDVFEAFFFAMAEAGGLPVRHQQADIEFDGVPGHIDGVLETPDGPLLVELKTMSDRYYSSFTRRPNDDRGYVTQLAVYSHALNLPAAWVVINKGNHQVSVVTPDEDALTAARERATNVIAAIKEIKTFDDVFEKLAAPPLNDDVCRKQPSGKLVIPESMRYSKWRHVFYDTYTEKDCYRKDKEYATDRTDRLQARQRLDSLLATA